MLKIYFYILLIIIIVYQNPLRGQCNFTVSSSGSNATYTQVYVLVDAANNIIAQNGTGTFVAVATGNYRLHALNYNPAEAPVPLPSALIGQSINLVGNTMSGCYNSDFLTDYTVRSCGGCAATRTTCSTDPIIITSSGAMVGYTQLYVLVDAITSQIIVSNATGNFTGQVVAGVGYQIHALNYEPTNAPNPLPTAGAMIGTIGNISGGCYNGDFLVDYVCLNVTNCATSCFKSQNVCPSENIVAKTSGENVAFSQLYVLADESGLCIDQNNTGVFATTAFVLGTTVRVHALNFDPANPPNTFVAGDMISNIVGGCYNSDFLVDYACFTMDCALLPIGGVQLTGAIVGADNQLTWRNNDETNISSYQLQVSKDGYTDFRNIGNTETASQQIQYSQLDEQPILQAYYRLRILRPNGDIDFSNIVFLQRNEQSNQFFWVFPNPTNQLIQVEFHASSAQNVSITITDMLGRTVQSIDVEAGEGRNRQTLDLQNLSSAMYIVSLHAANYTHIEKIIKH
jgi:hypothetical protein